MTKWAFINDAFVPEPSAKLHISDLSIQRGYGIFDFFKILNNTPVFLEEHLARFYNSARHMHLPVDKTEEELKAIITEL
ncbi:MAG TPA: aminotransferase class IV, partial [Flavisolibacter sp.]|nr:aminotransferase class IV [Flavisolibacter sp.]